MLAGFSDEAEDSNDGITHVVSDWYHGRVSATSNPLTSKCIDPWTLYFGAIYKCNNFIKNIQDPTIATYPFDTNQKEGWSAVLTREDVLHLESAVAVHVEVGAGSRGGSQRTEYKYFSD